MRSKNRKRVLLVSTAIILLCFMIIVGSTYALFTDTKTIKNHLQAGDMAITLKRVELVKTTLNESGFLETTNPPIKTIRDFTKATEDNVFELAADEKIVPGSKFEAKMQIENHSDVAFGYWIEIVCTDKSAGVDLAKQVKVTVNGQNDVIANGLTVGGQGNYVGVLGVNDVKNFTVAVEFVNTSVKFENGVLSSDNNAAQDERLSFDLIVYAVQVTTAP